MRVGVGGERDAERAHHGVHHGHARAVVLHDAEGAAEQLRGGPDLERAARRVRIAHVGHVLVEGAHPVNERAVEELLPEQPAHLALVELREDGLAPQKERRVRDALKVGVECPVATTRGDWSFLRLWLRRETESFRLRGSSHVYQGGGVKIGGCRTAEGHRGAFGRRLRAGASRVCGRGGSGAAPRAARWAARTVAALGVVCELRTRVR